MRIVAFWASAVFLLFLGVSGLQGFFEDWGLANTLGQRLCGVGQVIFGICGLLAGVGAILLALATSFGGISYHRRQEYEMLFNTNDLM